MVRNPYNRYAEQSIMTMTQGEMLAKLYEGLLKNMHLAVRAIEGQDISGANEALKKAQRILSYLTTTLDRKYPVAADLASLYSYFSRQLIAANVKKDAAPIKNIIPTVSELHVAFVECEKSTRAGQHAAHAGRGFTVSG